MPSRKYARIPSGLEDLLSQSNRLKSTFIIVSLDAQITCEKLIENVDDSFILAEKNLINILSSRNYDKHDMIHVVPLPTSKYIRDVLREVAKNHKNKYPLVLIAEKTHEKLLMETIDSLPDWKKSVRTIEDRLEWDDLTLTHKLDIMQTLERKFGIEVEVGREDEEQVTININGQLLAELINGRELTPFKKTLPDELSYYVKRTLVSRDIISPKIFHKSSTDIILIQGVNRRGISKLTEDKMTDTSSNQIRQGRLTIQYLVLDNPSHFEKISELTLNPVHWLKWEGQTQKLKWIRSRGNLRLIQNFVGTEQDHITEEKFCRRMKPNSQSPICITDTPGMGKSILLAQLGNWIANLYPDHNVFFLLMGDFVSQIKQAGNGKLDDDMSKAVVKVLEKLTCNNVVGELVLKSKLACASAEINTSIELMFDGLDEIPSSDLQLTYQLFKTIRISFPRIRIWITSRTHLMTELENELNTLGTTIQPFDEEDQIKFLTAFWSRSDSKLSLTKLTEYGRECLKSLKLNTKSTEQDIAGRPLQCLLIGEVYEGEAKENAEAENFNISTVFINSIAELYKGLVVKKFAKYFTIYVRDNFTGMEPLLDMHFQLSLKLIFPEKFHKLAHLFGEVELEELLKIGLLESSSTLEIPTFIHRTIAEYLVAWFVLTRLLSCEYEDGFRDMMSDLLYGGVFECKENETYLYVDGKAITSFEFIHQPIVYFLNSMVIDRRLAGLKGTSNVILSVDQQLLHKFAHASIAINYIQLFKFYMGLGLGDLDNQGGALFHEDILYIAIGKSGLELIKIVLDQFEKHHEFDSNVQVKSLREAVFRGEFVIVEYFLKERGLKWIVEQLEKGSEELVLDSIVMAQGYSEERNDQHKHIMERLAGINPDLLEMRDTYHRTPLLTGRYCPVQFLLTLIQLKANVLAKDKNGHTILHFYPNRTHLSREDCHMIVTSIPEWKLKTLVQAKESHMQWTTLMSLLQATGRKHGGPLSQTLERYHVAGADFNAVDIQGNSVLAIAIMHNANTATLNKLIELGAKLDWKGRIFMGRGKPEENTLLHAAAEVGNMEAIKFLSNAKDYNFKINAVDKDGLTPLDYALRKDQPEAALVLHEMGGSFSAIPPNSQNEQKSLLHLAVQNGHLETVRLLLRLEVDVNIVDGQNNTPLHLAVERSQLNKQHQLEILELLLSSGGDPTALNYSGETPIHVLLKSDDPNFQTFHLITQTTRWTKHLASQLFLHFIRTSKSVEEYQLNLFFREFELHQADLNYKDMAGNNPFHLAIDSGNINLGRFLLEQKKVDENSTNNRGETALFVAAKTKDKDAGLELIEILIGLGADITAKSVNNCNFLHSYVSGDHKPNPLQFDSIAEYLVRGKHIDLFTVAGGELNATPLHLAMLHLEPQKYTLEKLHKNGVDFKALDKVGDSILSYAIKGGRSTDLLSILITQFEANPGHLNKTQSSLLHIASRWGSAHSLKFMLELGSPELDVNLRNSDGNTPLHLAIQSVAEDGLQKCLLLLEKGADPATTDNEGRASLAIFMAQYFGPDKMELVQVLEGYHQMNSTHSKLDFRNSSLLTDAILSHLIIQLPLKLNIHNCPQLTPASLQAINEHSENLLSLEIGSSSHLLPREFSELQSHPGILNCPNLSTLVIWNHVAGTSDYWGCFSRSLNNTCLSSLDLSGCGVFRNLEFLKEFTLLSKLKLHNVLISDSITRGSIDDECLTKEDKSNEISGTVSRLEALVNKFIFPICHLWQLRHLDISTSNTTHHDKNHLIGTKPQMTWSIYPAPTQVLSLIVQHLPNLTHLDISGTNLAGTFQSQGGRSYPIPGLISRANNPLEYLGLFGTPYNASHREGIPAHKISGNKDITQILIGCESYMEMPEMLNGVLKELCKFCDVNKAGKQDETQPMTKPFSLILQSMNYHPRDISLQQTGSSCLLTLVKECVKSGPHPEMSDLKKAILQTTINAMAIHEDDYTIAKNGCHIIHNMIATQFLVSGEILFILPNLLGIIVKFLSSTKFKKPTHPKSKARIINNEQISIGSNMTELLSQLKPYLGRTSKDSNSNPLEKDALDLLNVLSMEFDDELEEVVSNTGVVEVLVKLIAIRNRKPYDEAVNAAISILQSLTRQHPLICEIFVKSDGVCVFSKLIHALQKEGSRPFIFSYVVATLANVAEVDDLRQELMTFEIISPCFQLFGNLDCLENFELSYSLSRLLVHLLCDGEQSWNVISPTWEMVNRLILDKALTWKLSSATFEHFRSFRPILKILDISHRLELLECQHWASLSLQYLVVTAPKVNIPLLEKEGGLPLLNDIDSKPMTPIFTLPSRLLIRRILDYVRLYKKKYG